MCTNVSIAYRPIGSPLVSARTMDWTEKFHSIVNYVPRGQKFPEQKPTAEIRWRNKYGFIGVGNKYPELPFLYHDGLNEKGLSAAALYLACTKYPDPKPHIPMLYNANVVSYVLGNFKKVQEVKTAFSRITVVDVAESAPELYIPFHFIISDAFGGHLILEYIDGKLQSYDSKIGVLTNQPALDWHLTNLSQYEQLTLEDKDNVVCEQEVTGSGQLGIPGDPTPPSRFVRAAFLSQSAFKRENVQESIGLARQIIQNLSVPMGTVILKSGRMDWSQWVVIRDHTRCSYYFYTDFNSKLYGLHLNELSFRGRKQKHINIEQPDWYEDITKVF